MKRLLLMLSLVVALASTAMATDKLAYTLTFNTGSNNSNVSTNLSDYFSTESQAYVNGITASTSAIYGTAKGLQLGSAKKAGTFTFSLSDAGAVSATKIVVTAKRYNAKDNNSATFTIGSQEGTVTPTGTDDAAYEILLDGSKISSISISTTLRVCFTKVEVYVAEGGDTPDPTPVAPGLPVVKFGDITADNNGEYQVVAGTEVNVTSTGAESIIVSNTTDGEQTIEGDTYSFTVDADEMYEFTGVNSVGSSEKFTVSFTVVEAPKTGGIVYTLVKSTSELVAGETYAIACADKGVAMSSEAQANYRPQIEVSVENGSFEANDNILAFVLEGESGNWNMSTRNYAGTDGYFDMGSKESDNYLTVVSSPCSWSIDINEAGDAEIKSAFNANTTRYVKYNASASRFATYKSGQAAVQLYREEVVAPKIFINEEEVFAGHVVDLVAGDKVIIRGHEANELHYKLDVNLAGMRAPATDTEGWVKHDSNEFTYEVPEGFENMSISLAAKAVNNGKESTPLQFTVSEGTSTGINGVEAEDAAAKTEWFTIQGVRVAAPAESGLYIRRQGSKVEKVVL